MPAQGVLNPTDTVSGVVVNGGAAAGQTFQTGDTINGGGALANNILKITSSNTAGGGATVTTIATVNNVSRIEHTNLNAAASTTTFNQANYTGVLEEWVVRAAAAGAGSGIIINNASAATTYGNSAGFNDSLSVAFAPGATNQTFKVALAGAGSQQLGNSTVTYAGAATDINAITLATSGNNYTTLTNAAAANTKTITVLGAGNNNLTVAGVFNSSTASPVTIDASAATGNNVIDVGASYNSSIVIKGTTGSSLTTVGLQLTGVQTVPTWTNVDILQLDAGSTGNLFMTGLGIKDVVSFNTTNQTATLTNNTALNNLTYKGAAAAGTALGFGSLTLAGSSLSGTADVVNIAFDNSGIARGAADGATLGIQTLTGAETVNIDTSNAIGASGNFTFGTLVRTGLIDANLTTFDVNSASTGVHTFSIQAGAGTATGGTLLTADFSGVAGSVTALFDGTYAAGGSPVVSGFNNGGSILGAAGNNNITVVDTATTKTTLITGSFTNGNLTFVGGSGNTGAVSYSLTAGNGNNTITTGAGADTINSGNGNNNVNTGGGVDAIVTGSGNDTITGGAAADTMAGGSGADQFNYVFTNSTFALEAADTGTVATGVIDILSDFTTGTDTINFTTAGANVTSTAAGGVANYAAALAAANVTFGAGTDAYNIQAYGSGTSWTAVLFIDSDGASAGTADGAIQIGVVGQYATAAAALAAVVAADIV